MYLHTERDGFDGVSILSGRPFSLISTSSYRNTLWSLPPDSSGIAKCRRCASDCSKQGDWLQISIPPSLLVCFRFSYPHEIDLNFQWMELSTICSRKIAWLIQSLSCKQSLLLSRKSCIHNEISHSLLSNGFQYSFLTPFTCRSSHMQWKCTARVSAATQELHQ